MQMCLHMWSSVAGGMLCSITAETTCLIVCATDLVSRYDVIASLESNYTAAVTLSHGDAAAGDQAHWIQTPSM